MMHPRLTNDTVGANRASMWKGLIAMAVLGAAGGCVNVTAPDKPIEINLNVNIKQEVVVKLQKDAQDLITSNPELFPK